MYKTPQEAKSFVRDFLPLLSEVTGREVVLCGTFVCLPALVEALLEAEKVPPVSVGAQDMHWEKEGAYTGEVSAGMLTAIGVTHVIIGHSERRQYFGETDATVNKKLASALDAGLTPIVCVGEQIEEREAGITDDVLRRQCAQAFRSISGKKAHKIVVAYEPVWAIGTGKTATPAIAASAHSTIRIEAAKAFGDQLAGNMRILYGGSVKPENAVSLMAEDEIDGALVGGASLDAKAFATIVKA